MPRLPRTLVASLVAVSPLPGCLLLNPLAELTQDRESDAGNRNEESADAGPQGSRQRPTAANPEAEDAGSGAAGAQIGSEVDAGPSGVGGAMVPTGPGAVPSEGGGGAGAGAGGSSAGAGAGGAGTGGGAGAEQGPGGASQGDPDAAAPIAQLAVGNGLTCVVRTDQEIECWGRNDVGQAEPPAGAYETVAITADGMAACGILADGALACWGEERFADVPEGEFVDVALASEAACAIRADGALACWGSLAFGLHQVPTGTFRDVSMRAEQACAVREDQTLTCWGQDGRVATPPEGTFVTVDTGNAHHCAVSTDGPLVCWGTDDAGQSSPPLEDFVASASLGSADGPVSCGVTTTGALTCWGTEAERIVEREEGDFTQLAMSATHLCALTAAGEVQCWTEALAGNEYGQAKPPWTNVRQLAVGSAVFGGNAPFVCAVFEDDRVECFGDTALAAGVPFDRVHEVAIGSGYACVTGLDGALACWGPTEVANLPTRTDLVSITLGYGSHGCALRADDTVGCWGFANSIEGTFHAIDYGGNLFVGVRTEGPLEFWDDGVFAGEALPDFPFGTYQHVSVGPVSTCAIDEQRAATCVRHRPEDPFPVQPEGEWLSIDLQEGSSCGLRPDGTIECWQGNREHQLPTESFVDFTERLDFGCGRRADKTVSCWGELHR